MKQRSLTPKAYSVHDLKTTQSHSNFDQITPLKNPHIPAICSKTRKPSNINQKSKQFPAKVGKVIYKCGCIGPAIQSKTFQLPNDFRNPLQNKRFLSQNKNKSSNSSKGKLLSQSKKKVQRSSSLTNILNRITTLCQDYDELLKQDTQRNRKFSVIKYVPKEVIKSVDKIKRIDRPIERKIVKVKKIPRQIIKYKQVDVEVSHNKQQLVFVDPIPLKPLVKHINVHKEVVKQIPTHNSTNERMRSDLNLLRQKRARYHNRLNDSGNQIQLLKQKIKSIGESKSLDRIVIDKQIPLTVILNTKDDINTSIEHTNVNSSNDQSCLIRSKSQPLKNSILSYKSKMLVNGRQQSNRISSFQNILPGTSESLVYIGSSPQIITSSKLISENTSSQSYIKITKI